MLYQKNKFHRLVLPLKNCIDWISTRREEKHHNLKNVNFGKKAPKVGKQITFIGIYIYLWLTHAKLLLKCKSIELQD